MGELDWKVCPNGLRQAEVENARSLVPIDGVEAKALIRTAALLALDLFWCWLVRLELSKAALDKCLGCFSCKSHWNIFSNGPRKRKKEGCHG